MKIRMNDNESNQAYLHDKMIDGASQTYRSFRDYVTIQQDDSMGVMLFKLSLNLLGLLFMIILSPFFIIGLTIAFAAVF